MSANYLLPLLSLAWLETPVLVLFFISSVFLVLVVLVQRGSGGGLAGAFGGGSDSSVLGTKAGTFLGKITIITGGVFLGLALIYAMLHYASEA